MSGTEVQTRGSWLRGAGSPGLLGYVLAFLASAGALGLMVPVSAILLDLAHLSPGLDDLFYVAAVGVITAICALVYGLPAAAVGCALVHLVCLPVTEQRFHVAMAGVAGAAAGVVYDHVLFAGFHDWLWLELGIATAIGRAAAIPLARRRQS